ncbi:MAG: hypothetical protein QHH05_02075 [Syntrophomonadaceae bacterium]|jgi:hypothetical protein|nr:hypothetical protein [Syntrophomonadaceae bacterium]MDH7497224.1 hypothetical protein [Syntrophomonadaceae bacterium]
MSRWNWQSRLAALLILLSITFYALHYAIFRDGPFILRYFIAQMGFLPVNVLLVVLVLNQLLARRERAARLRKMNMAIGVFFGELGTALLGLLSPAAGDAPLLQELAAIARWSPPQLESLRARVRDSEFHLRLAEADLERLRGFLLAHRDFLLSLLQNPNLLEHETFTDVLWAVFHLTEELRHRPSLAGLRRGDVEHLCGDTERVFGRLLVQWLDYLRHLRENYPYLFSLEIRLSPFDPAARVQVAD